jgi:hypothetical protein
MDRHTRRSPGGDPGLPSEHIVVAALKGDTISNSTVADRIADIRIGLHAVGAQRGQALAMLEAAITDDIISQADELADYGVDVSDAAAYAGEWWSWRALDAIRRGVALARERVA